MGCERVAGFSAPGGATIVPQKIVKGDGVLLLQPIEEP